MALTDTAVLGHYSTEALATIGFVLPVFVALMAAIVPFGTAVQVLVARWKGAEDLASIARMAVFAPLALGALGLVLAGVVALGAPAFTRLVGGGDPPPEAAAALRVLACCFPLQAVTHALRGVFGGLGETKVAMYTALIVNLANIPVSYLLVWGLDWGAIGAAAATLVATVGGTVFITAFALRRLRPRLRPHPPGGLAGGPTAERHRLGAGGANYAKVLMCL